MTRSTIPSLAALAVLLAAGAARADGPAPPPAYAPYPAPPLVYAPPPSYAPLPYQVAPYTPMKRRSTGRMSAGIVLLAVGGTALLAGATMTIVGVQGQGYPEVGSCVPGLGPCTQGDIDVGLTAAGIVTLVLGSASIAAGVPLLVSGMQRVPDTGAARLVPEVRPGPRGVSFAWSF